MMAFLSNRHQLVKLLKQLLVTLLLRTILKGVDLAHNLIAAVITHKIEIHSGIAMLAHIHVEMAHTITVTGAGAIKTMEIKNGMHIVILMVEAPICSIKGFQGILEVLHHDMDQPNFHPLRHVLIIPWCSQVLVIIFSFGCF